MKNLTLICALIPLLACTTAPSRKISSDSSGPTAEFAGTITPALPLDEVPTLEQLYYEGKFMVRVPHRLGWNENHYGHALDLDARRPAVNLKGTVFAQKYGREDSSLIGNFYYNGSFYMVRVPNHAVKSVYFQLSYFPPLVLGHYIAAHSLLRFELEKDHAIQIVAPMPSESLLEALRTADPAHRLELLPEELKDGAKLDNVVISAEAQWTKDDPKKTYDLKRGQRGAFIQVVRFESMMDRFIEFYKTGHIVDQIELDPTHGKYDMDSVLATGLAISARDGITKLYQTLFYNCTTLAFEIVETGQGVSDDRIDVIRKFMEARVPVIAPSKVKELGGIDVQPIYTDPSLVGESREAYQRIVESPKRALCTSDISSDDCSHLQKAVELLAK